jgi:RNA polymerase sigma-70 factor (ECF subfamily)
MADPLMGAAPLDSELVRAAQAGDAGSLGLVLTRHRADLYAVALAVLGHSPDAEDAVQEATLIALRRIGDVRELRESGHFGHVEETDEFTTAMLDFVRTAGKGNRA